MADQEQIRKIKCPHCGWIRSMPVKAVEDLSTSTVVRGLKDDVKAAFDKVRETLQDSQLDEANAWIDMPKCPNCQNTYRYNARTGQTQE